MQGWLLEGSDPLKDIQRYLRLIGAYREAREG